MKNLLTTEWALLDTFARELLEKEELEYDEIEQIFAAYKNQKKALNYNPRNNISVGR